MRFKSSSKFVEYCHPEIQVHNQYKQLSTMFNFISDMFFNSDPYQNETLLVFFLNDAAIAFSVIK
ncbi:hypothetical protein VEE78_21380 [Escherichia coli]|nr:hypothetical protein VEGS05_21670 [Escherichia coli]BED17905.1 hypothetical protein VEE78_21380 [Escherichia coli]